MLQRYIDLLSSRNEKFFVIDNHLFKPYNRMAVPFGPAQTNYSISEYQARLLARKLKCHIVRWTNGFKEQNEHSQWYAVVCRDFIHVENLKSKFRSEIFRGLNNCKVNRIDAEFLAKFGYEVYFSASSQYKNTSFTILDNETFSYNISQNKKFDDIIHFWGVFKRDKLIGYCYNYIFDNDEAAYTTAKFDPEYLKDHSSYALFYEMNKYYLSDQNFEYVNDGFRSILHETNIQDYLIRKFNFYKAYTNLHIYYSFPLKTIMPIAYPFKVLLVKFDPRFSALFELEKIRRNCHE